MAWHHFENSILVIQDFQNHIFREAKVNCFAVNCSDVAD